MIMEDCIRTFMNFLKADKVKTCQAIASFFKRNRRGSVDPTLLALVRKVNTKVSNFNPSWFRNIIGILYYIICTPCKLHKGPSVSIEHYMWIGKPLKF